MSEGDGLSVSQIFASYGGIAPDFCMEATPTK
jgi:hypothetical protein